MLTRFLLLFSLLFVLTQEVIASHIIGGQMTYTCLGNNEYHIKLSVYRDCNCSNCAEFDDFAPISVYLGSSLYSNNSIEGIMSNIEVLPDPVSPCMVVPDICVERLEYEFDITLPPSTEPYHIIYQRCCRAETASNISIDQVGATYAITLTPEAQAVCNSSPIFNNVPPTAICVNVPFLFDHSATDADGDSLVYTFCTLLAGGGDGGGGGDCTSTSPNPACPPPFDEIPYVTPTYTTSNPMGGAPLISVDPVTGQITGTVTTVGIFVIGICIEEYRDGVLISYSRREIQLVATNCQSIMNAAVDADSQIGNNFAILNCGEEVLLNNISSPLDGVTDYTWMIISPSNDTTFSAGLDPTTANWDAILSGAELGNYSVMLTLNDFAPWCADTAYISLVVVNPPTADFSFAYDTCVVGPVVFTGLSTPGTVALTDWDWDFGDGTGISSAQNPNYLYAAAGEIPVTLTVTDANDCAHDTTLNITWYPVPPTIIIVPDIFAGCAPQVINFDNQSTPLNSDYEIIWDFGDGSPTVDEISPAHTYLIGGVFDIHVDITSPEGCQTDSLFTALVTVEIPPIAISAIDYDTCSAGEMQLTNMSTDGSNPINQWVWTLGNGNTAAMANHDFTYANAGTYDIQLWVEDIYGCNDSITKTIEWYPRPQINATFVLDDHCRPTIAGFQNQSWPFTNEYDILWDFDNGQTSTLATTGTTYTEAGYYNIGITITSPIGCVADTTVNNWIWIHELPVAQINMDYDSCVAIPINFSNTGSIGDIPLITWEWNLDAGYTQSAEAFTFGYPDPGVYEIELIITDGFGCKDTANTTLNWYPIPDPLEYLVVNPDGCAPENVGFIYTATPHDSTYTLLWDFGNGDTGQGENDSTTYLLGGLYDVELTVLSPNGCELTNLYPERIDIRTRPVGSYTFSPDSISSLTPDVQFTNTTQDQSVYWYWQFDDEGVSLNENPTYAFQDTGMQTVTFIITAVNGCRDTVYGLVDVWPEATLFMPNAFSPNEDSQNEGFQGKGYWGLLLDYHLEIYNRWGELVFVSNDPNETWNGKKNNVDRACDPGLYKYKLHWGKPRDQYYDFTGEIILVR
jgi:gliding motility-associated-like protein